MNPWRDIVGDDALALMVADRPDVSHVFELFHPEQQSFPASVAEVTAAGFSSNVLAGWALQETTGTTFTDFSGNSLTLTRNGAATKARVGQRATGLFDGTSFRSQRAFESANAGATTDCFSAASSASLDMDWTAARGFLFVFRSAAPPPLTSSIIGKASTRYISINLNTSGHLLATVYDGTNAVTTNTLVNHCDGAWHWAYVRFDPVTDTLKIDTDLVTGATSSTAVITSPTNAGVFSLGGQPSGHNAAGCQVRWCVVFGDVTTTVAAIQAWWRHGRAPSWLNYTRASSMHTPVSFSETTGDVVAGWAMGQVAYEYNTLCSTNSLKLGLPVDIFATNLLAHSDMNLSSWTLVNATRAAYSVDDPRGFLAAVEVTKTAANGRIRYASFAVTAGSTYTASCWIRWDGADTAPIFAMTGITSAVVQSGMTGAVGDGLWRRCSFTFTAGTSEQIIFDVYPSQFATATGRIWCGLPMANIGSVAAPWVPTAGATASMSPVSAYVSVPGLISDVGTLKVWATLRASDTPVGRAFGGVTNAAGLSGVPAFVNARTVSFASSEVTVVASYDSAGAFASQTAGPILADIASVESVVTGWWDRNEKHGWALQHNRNGQVSTSAADLPAGGSAPIVYLGSTPNASTQLQGVISKVRVWRDVELSA